MHSIHWHRPRQSRLDCGEIGNFVHFSRAEQLVKIAGIQPTACQSGEYERQHTPVSHKGGVRLRTYLFGGVFTIVYNLFLLRLGYAPDFIGQVNSVGLITFTLCGLPAGAFCRKLIMFMTGGSTR